jgi:hypothetical protein
LVVTPKVEAAVEAAFARGRLDEVEDAINWKGVERPMAADFEKAGLATLQAAGKAGEEFLPATVTGRFDATNPLAVKWAKEKSANLVREVSDSTVDALRTHMVTAFEEGQHPRVAARSIMETIGLTRRQESYAANFFAKQIDLGVSPEVARKQTSKYRKKLLKRRATLIARTESIAASNQGQQQLWRQMAYAGGLSPTNTKREWIVTPDDRLDARVCLPMAGQQVGLEEPFTTGTGSTVMTPPAHPGCRCAIALAQVSKPAEKPAPVAGPDIPGIEFTGDVDASARTYVTDYMRAMPRKARKILTDNNYDVRVSGESLDGLWPELGSRFRGTPGVHIGAYEDESARIGYALRPRGARGKALDYGADTPELREVMRHEVGHAIDYNLGPTEAHLTRMSDLSEFQVIWDNDVTTMLFAREGERLRQVGRELGYFIKEGTGPREAFAQGYAVVTGGGEEVFPFSEGFPNVVQWMKQFVSKHIAD